jgi:multidrug efflux pump
MSRLQGEVADALLKDPAVDSLSSAVGVDGINPMLSQGRITINLKSIDQRGSLSTVMADCRTARIRCRA